MSLLIEFLIDTSRWNSIMIEIITLFFFSPPFKKKHLPLFLFGLRHIPKPMKLILIFQMILLALGAQYRNIPSNQPIALASANATQSKTNEAGMNNRKFRQCIFPAENFGMATKI